ncbi:MAG TPA: HAMP domain-containing sensor histidine kinase [Caulobacteraceae bacterium]|nr:HAMP domain-containing sensor histidine kinase [Caulobacteraceae bacterium]
MFRSTSARLAAVYTAAFALSVVVLGAITFFTTRAAMRQQFDARISAEASALAQEFNTEGLTGVVQAVEERERTPGALDYGLEGPDGRPLAGQLAGAHATLGWSTVRLAAPRGSAESLRVLTTTLPQGYRLVVGDDDERSEALQETVLQGFGWAFAGVVVLGILGGYGLSFDVHRRLAAMSGAAEAIIDGDLGRRIPVRGSDDDLDRLAVTFNRMLDRIATLMESLRQVSSDIAHDLRTPLTRLRQRLEASRTLRRPADRAEALAGALEDVDAILDTFAALLRIAQIESGARRAAFRPVDLTALARGVVDDFAPSAEDAGQALAIEAGGPLVVEGDRELLTQMLVNLVENALRHAGAKAAVVVRTAREGADVIVQVADNGLGVPLEDRRRVFDRFYRLERSRSTPGSGLGLALVAAVARLHGAVVGLSDAEPGLVVRVVFHDRARADTLAFPNVAESSPPSSSA